MRQVKQVIVLRKDLNMRKGKMIAQGAHASLTALLNYAHLEPLYRSTRSFTIKVHKDNPVSLWLFSEFTKIVVSVNSEEELLAIYNKAKQLINPVPLALITDAGHTEFHGTPTKTAVAIGPWWSDVIDKVTGDLPLL